MTNAIRSLLVTGCFGIGLSASAAPGPELADAEDWFSFDPQASHESINDGNLVFLDKPPAQAVHHHHNTIVIRPESLRNGWTRLVQCHDHLDPFPRAQVLYHKKRTRNIRISSAVEIGDAWVEDNSVQLRDVNKGARLCVEADSRALTSNEDGTYTLRNGPFMRRFLDGYFPMRVSVDVELPRQLRFASISPAQQEGFRVEHGRDRVYLDAWFEGKLNTEIVLQPASQARP